VQRVESACKTPTAESELHCNDKTPIVGSDWCGGDRTLIVRSEVYYGSRTPIAGSDLEDKIMGDLQRAEGTMVTKECQVLQIAIYIRVQQ